jgi:predicted ATPase
MNEKNKIPKIVITGGPGGGKTTALDLFQREFKSGVKIVPEAATMLFEYGLHREINPERLKLLQSAIYKMQLTLEASFHHLNQDRLLICDRGTLDGIAYWPGEETDFFKTIGSTRESEVSRYDAVIFFQSAAGREEDIKSNNPFRYEDAPLAKLLDEKLKLVWQRHPNFHYVPSDSSFMRKIARGLLTINSVLDSFNIKDKGPISF